MLSPEYIPPLRPAPAFEPPVFDFVHQFEDANHRDEGSDPFSHFPIAVDSPVRDVPKPSQSFQSELLDSPINSDPFSVFVDSHVNVDALFAEDDLPSLNLFT